jgi:hypothetical protein
MPSLLTGDSGGFNGLCFAVNIVLVIDSAVSARVHDTINFRGGHKGSIASFVVLPYVWRQQACSDSVMFPVHPKMAGSKSFWNLHYPQESRASSIGLLRNLVLQDRSAPKFLDKDQE